MKTDSKMSKPRKPNPTDYLHSVKLQNIIPQVEDSHIHVQSNFVSDFADAYISERQQPSWRHHYPNTSSFIHSRI
jgi:hypothetical protein